MTQTITRLNPPSLPNAGNAGYSQISITEPGRLAFISGQVASHADGTPTPPTLLEQTEVVVGNLDAALAAIGATPDDIALLKIYVVDMTPERMEGSMPLLMAFLDGAQPSLTGIGVSALAGPDLQLEIEMVVRLPT